MLIFKSKKEILFVYLTIPLLNKKKGWHKNMNTFFVVLVINIIESILFVYLVIENFYRRISFQFK